MVASARRIAFEPKLEYALRAGPLFRPRGNLSVRPEILTEKLQVERATQRRYLDAVNSGSFASQTKGGGFPTPGGGTGGGGENETDEVF